MGIISFSLLCTIKPNYIKRANDINAFNPPSNFRKSIDGRIWYRLLKKKT